MVSEPGVPRWTIAPLRIYLGAAFLKAASGKIGANWQPWPGWMAGVIHDRLPRSLPLYQGFLASVVVPHVSFFAHAVACGEVVVGCLLLVGLATRAAALGGIFLTLNYLLLNGAGQLVPDQSPFTFGSNDPVFVLAGVTLMVGAAGRAFGADRYLHRLFPRIPIF